MLLKSNILDAPTALSIKDSTMLFKELKVTFGKMYKLWLLSTEMLIFGLQVSLLEALLESWQLLILNRFSAKLTSFTALECLESETKPLLLISHRPYHKDSEWSTMQILPHMFLHKFQSHIPILPTKSGMIHQWASSKFVVQSNSHVPNLSYQTNGQPKITTSTYIWSFQVSCLQIYKWNDHYWNR